MDGVINAVDPQGWSQDVLRYLDFMPQVFLDTVSYIAVTLFIAAVSVVSIGVWSYHLIMKGKKDDDDDNNRRGNQALQPLNENALEDVDKKTVKVELRNGMCYVERGEDQSMAAKCNAALQEMNDFQRQFLATVPAGQPNKLLFTEEIRRNAQGGTKTSFYFTNREKETAGITSFFDSLKRKVSG